MNVPQGQQPGKSQSSAQHGTVQRGSVQQGETAQSNRTSPLELASQTARQSVENARELTFETRQISAGRAGECNLQIEWIDVPVGSGRSVQFVIATATGHELEAVLEQPSPSYRKSYQGTSSLKTAPVPLGTIGTRGKVTVSDVTTGEISETRWTWVSLGLWQRVVGWLKRQLR